MENKLKLGLPKGSLQEQTIELFRKAGYKIYTNNRGYKPPSNDPELAVRMLRAQEIGRYVSQGFLDCGITGRDWIAENNAKVKKICNLKYSKATNSPTRWVLVVPENSAIQSVQDLEGKRIATEAVGLVQSYLRQKKVKAKVEFSWGATEAKVPELVDAIVDITETGSSLRANKLRIIDTLMESYPQFVCNKIAYSDSWKKAKMQKIATLLLGAQEAKDKVGLKMNLKSKNLNKILTNLPALKKPTVSTLANLNNADSEKWVAIETIIDEAIVREIIPELKKHGAQDIIEYPLNKVIY